jgi:hypothetical protein
MPGLYSVLFGNELCTFVALSELCLMQGQLREERRISYVLVVNMSYSVDELVERTVHGLLLTPWTLDCSTEKLGEMNLSRGT